MLGDFYKMDKNENVRVIDLRQLLFYIMDHLKMIILLVVVFGIAMGTYRYYTLNSTSIEHEVFNSIIEKNKKSANPNYGVNSYSSEREVIPGTCLVKALFYVDYNFNVFDNNPNVDYNAILTRYQYDIITKMISNDALISISQSINNKYKDLPLIKPDDLKYMINYNGSGFNNISYSVTDINSERAMDIALLLRERLIEESSYYKFINEITEIEEPAINNDTTYILAQNNIWKDTILFVIIGCVLGMILSCTILFLLFLVQYKVWTEDDFKMSGISLLSTIHRRDDKANKDYVGLACRLSFYKDSNDIYIVPVDDMTNIDSIAANVNKRLKDIDSSIQLRFVNSIIGSPESLMELQKASRVIVVASYGRTSVKNLKFVINQINVFNTCIIEGLIVDCNH